MGGSETAGGFAGLTATRKNETLLGFRRTTPFSDSTVLRSLVKGACRAMDPFLKRSDVVGGVGVPPPCGATMRKWTPGFQCLQHELIRTIQGTDLEQTEEQASRC